MSTLTRPLQHGPTVTQWVALCALGEAVGMSAAAGASRLTTTVVGEPSGPREGAVAIGFAAAAGVVEGLALGSAQAAGLVRYLPRRARRRWLDTTTAVAVVGWALASLPSTVLAGDSGAEPSRPLSVAGGAALGTLMGLALGGAQSLVLRGHVPHPRRWVLANAVAWTPAIAVIFTAASAPDASWPTVAVVGLGTASGLTAGAIVGALTAPVAANGKLHQPVSGGVPRGASPGVSLPPGRRPSARRH